MTSGIGKTEVEFLGRVRLPAICETLSFLPNTRKKEIISWARQYISEISALRRLGRRAVGVLFEAKRGYLG